MALVKEVDIYYNADFPIIMTARADGGYPMVHAILVNEIAPPRLVVEFSGFWTLGKNTYEDMEYVRGELMREVFDSYGHHHLLFKIEDTYYKVAKGILNKYGLTLIAMEEQ